MELPQVGQRINVYWKDDDEFYPGLVAAALPDAKFRVEYDDGDVEELALEQERWNVIPKVTAPIQPPNPSVGSTNVPPNVQHSIPQPQVVQNQVVDVQPTTSSASKMDLANVLNDVSLSPSNNTKSHSQLYQYPSYQPTPPQSNSPKQPNIALSFPPVSRHVRPQPFPHPPAMSSLLSPSASFKTANVSATVSTAVQREELQATGKPQALENTAQPIVTPSPTPPFRSTPTNAVQKPSPKRLAPPSKAPKTASAKRDENEIWQRQQRWKNNSGAPSSRIIPKSASLPHSHRQHAGDQHGGRYDAQPRNPTYTSRHPDHTRPLSTDRIPRRQQYTSTFGGVPRSEASHHVPPARPTFYGSTSRKKTSNVPATQQEIRPVKRIKVPNHGPSAARPSGMGRPPYRFPSQSRPSRSEQQFSRSPDQDIDPKPQDLYRRSSSQVEIERQPREDRRWSAKPRNGASVKIPDMMSLSRRSQETPARKSQASRQRAHDLGHVKDRQTKRDTRDSPQKPTRDPRRAPLPEREVKRSPIPHKHKSKYPEHLGSSEVRSWPSYCPVDGKEIDHTGQQVTPVVGAVTTSAVKISSPPKQPAKPTPKWSAAQHVRYLPVASSKDNNGTSKRSKKISREVKKSNRPDKNTLHQFQPLKPQEVQPAITAPEEISHVASDAIREEKHIDPAKNIVPKLSNELPNSDFTATTESAPNTTTLNELLAKVQVASSEGVHDKLNSMENTFSNCLTRINDMTREAEEQATQLGHTIDDLQKSVPDLKKQASNLLMKPQQLAIITQVASKQWAIVREEIKDAVSRLQEDLREEISADIRAAAAFFRADLSRSIRSAIRDVLGDFLSSRAFVSKKAFPPRKRKHGDMLELDVSQSPKADAQSQLETPATNSDESQEATHLKKPKLS